MKKSANPKKKLTAMFLVDDKEKSIDFGATGYKDFTIYSKGDKATAEKMRNAYIARHKVSENFNNPLSAGALSRFVLWESPTVAGGIRAFKKRFNL